MPKAKWKNFTDEELKQMVADSTSFVEVQKKMGYSGKSGSIQNTLKEVFANKNIDYSHFTNKYLDNKNNWILCSYGDRIKVYRNKEKIFQEREYRCECCGIDSWNGKSIKLQVHHIDGNHNNNIRSNLMILCPNCHSQTDNWTYRKNQNNITDEQFLEALKNTANICQACRALGITPNQNNYKRAKKLIEDSKL